MIEYIKGNIFDTKCHGIVNTVNTVSVMGKGLALAFKQKYPEMFEQYKKICANKSLEPGGVWAWHNPDKREIVFNFATKKHWRDPSEYEWIQKGLFELSAQMRAFEVKDIAIPALGCANGQLSWDKVKPMIQEAHDMFWVDKKIEVYEPNN